MLLTRRHPELSNELFEQLSANYLVAFAGGHEVTEKASQQAHHCQIEGTDYFIKHYQTKGPFATLRSLIGASRADNSCRYAEFFAKFKIPCPQHLLVIKKLGFANCSNYLIMEKAPGIPLFEFIQAGSQLTLSDCAIKNIAKLITKMQWLGIAHGDLHTRNFIIAEDDSVQIIDLDNVRSSKNRRHKDITRFTRAVEHGARYTSEILSALEESMQQPIDLNS